jgi:pyridoxine kinase
LQCAVFPLQLLGFEVDPVNSVQFSNHTGYPSWSGEVMDGEALWRLVEGLEANGLLAGYTHLLTGYIGSTSLLRTIVRVAEKLRQYNQDLVYGELGGCLGGGTACPAAAADSSRRC